mmetsp:Transcript_26858/g.61927  ORF Transcript_26858/g.61927 Transcript_26858/m.61927 type:complete len:89 (+) Transcript_26858:181-447(+)
MLSWRLVGEESVGGPRLVLGEPGASNDAACGATRDGPTRDGPGGVQRCLMLAFTWCEPGTYPGCCMSTRVRLSTRVRRGPQFMATRVR